MKNCEAITQHHLHTQRRPTLHTWRILGDEEGPQMLTQSVILAASRIKCFHSLDPSIERENHEYKWGCNVLWLLIYINASIRDYHGLRLRDKNMDNTKA